MLSPNTVAHAIAEAFRPVAARIASRSTLAIQRKSPGATPEGISGRQQLAARIQGLRREQGLAAPLMRARYSFGVSNCPVTSLADQTEALVEPRSSILLVAGL